MGHFLSSLSLLLPIKVYLNSKLTIKKVYVRMFQTSGVFLMSFIRDFFNHEKAVERRIKQLEALNDLIEERKKEASDAEAQVLELEDRIAQIKAMYPGLSADESVQKYFELKREQKQMLEQISLEREALKKEKEDLVKYKNSFINVEDIIFAVYTMNNGDIIANAFIYVGDTDYADKDDRDDKGNKKIYKAKYYKSISGDRIIGLNLKLDKSLISTTGETYDGYVINTNPDVWFTFTDICISLGSSLYLNSKVNIEQINEILQLFISNNDFVMKGKKVNIVKKRKKSR